MDQAACCKKCRWKSIECPKCTCVTYMDSKQKDSAREIRVGNAKMYMDRMLKK